MAFRGADFIALRVVGEPGAIGTDRRGIRFAIGDHEERVGRTTAIGHLPVQRGTRAVPAKHDYVPTIRGPHGLRGPVHRPARPAVEIHDLQATGSADRETPSVGRETRPTIVTRRDDGQRLLRTIGGAIQRLQPEGKAVRHGHGTPPPHVTIGDGNRLTTRRQRLEVDARRAQFSTWSVEDDVVDDVHPAKSLQHLRGQGAIGAAHFGPRVPAPLAANQQSAIGQHLHPNDDRC